MMLYSGLVLALSALLYVPIVMAGSLYIWDGWAIFTLMWLPGLSGILTSLIVYRSLRPLGLTGNAWAIPLILLGFLIPLTYTLGIHLGLDRLGVIKVTMLDLPLVTLAVGFFVSLKSTFGSELGWRGFAAPVFSRVFGFGWGQFMLGLLWFIQQLPAQVFTEYGETPFPVAGNLILLVTLIGGGLWLARARQSSASVWPAAAFMSSHNLFFHYMFSYSLPKSGAAGYWVGEQGLALCLVAAGLGVFALLRVHGAHWLAQLRAIRGAARQSR